jgi:hypothetical protein
MHPDGHDFAPAASDPTDAATSVDRDPMDGVWLTKAQLAAVRRISVASADRLIRRQGWRKQPGNDGRARVFVPRTWVEPRAAGPADAPVVDPADRMHEHPVEGTGSATDISRAISTLEAALASIERRAEAEAAALRQRADQAEKRANQAESQAEQADNRANRAEQAISIERNRADALQGQVQELLVQLASREADAKAANDRAWATGEAAGALREQAAALEQRIEAERARADRAESQAAHERQDFLDLESRTRRELDVVRREVEQARIETERVVEAARIAQAKAEADAAELREAEAERRARGLLGRLRAAWRGQ